MMGTRTSADGHAVGSGEGAGVKGVGKAEAEGASEGATVCVGPSEGARVGFREYDG